MTAILSAIAPIFVLIGIGVMLQHLLPRQSAAERMLCKIGLGSCETMTSVLNRFALYLALPALILNSLVNTPKDDLLEPALLFLNAALLVAIILIVYAITRALKTRPALANAYIFGAFFGNVAYIGFPFIQQLAPGSEGIVSLLIAIHVTVAFSVGLFILEHSKRKHGNAGSMLKSIFLNPLILSVLVGLALLFLDVSLPAVLATAVAMLGNSASPVVLVAVGTFMASEWRFDKTIWHSVAISGIKLIITPAVFLVAALFMKQSLALDISILEAAMPVALTSFALSELYPMDRTVIANAIVISTIAAVVTLTGFALVIQL